MVIHKFDLLTQILCFRKIHSAPMILLCNWKGWLRSGSFKLLVGSGLLLFLLHPGRFSSWSHEIISDNDIAENLIDSKLRSCDSDDLKPRLGARDILQEVLKEKNAGLVHPSTRTDKKEPTCHSNYPVFIVIPFRNRDRHLSILLPFLHRFLQAQNLKHTTQLLNL